ncbi:MAG: TRAP transporter large permease [Deltaproteobacteria bacterium]|nr:TRAP transporter large permease [Deltaproteobacteria bacterium]
MSLLFITIIILLIFILLEAPLFTVIAGLSIVCFYFVDYDPLSIQMILIEMNRLASMPVLMALPMFTFTGCLLTESNAPVRIMDFLRAVTGRVPGGMAIAAVLGCAFFAALTGASGVTIVAIGGILYPILIKEQYSETFSLGLLTTSGSLGLLFPPSLPIILYGVVAKINISEIFMAALIPGILSITVLSFYSFCKDYSFNKKRGRPVSQEVSHPGIWKAFIAAVWEWPVIVLIVVGIYGGFVTIAEVSAVIAVYVTIVECFILKEVRFFRQLPGIIVEGAVLSGAIIVILSFALGFTGYLVDEKIPNLILGYLTGITQNKYVFLCGLNIFLLAVGCIMDIFSAIVIIVPIIVPVALQYGVDPVHLCIIFLLNLEIGYSTPPVGMNLFIASLKFQKPVPLLYRASIPYLLLLFALLLVVTYIPSLSLCLIR